MLECHEMTDVPGFPAPGPGILLLDDHPALRMGLRAIILSRWKGASVREASSLPEVRRILETGGADLAILDHAVGEERGVDLVPELVGAGCRVLVLSMSSDRMAMVLARRWGAMGWVGKDESPSAILEAIASVLDGRALWKDPPVGLSPKETEVLDGMYHRVALKELAQRIGVAYTTLNTHKRRILSKLGMADGRDPEP